VSLLLRSVAPFCLLPLLIGAAPAQKPTGNDQTPEVAVWKPSKQNVLALAKGVDARLAKSRRFEIGTTIQVKMPKRGGVGRMEVVNRFQDRKHFDLQFPAVSFKKRSEFLKVYLKADGKQLLYTADPKKSLYPMGSVKLLTAAKPTDWALGHPRYLLASLLGESAFGKVVAQAQKEKSVYQVKAEERTIRRLGVPVKQYRITIAHRPEAAKRTGEFLMETTIDSRYMLPTNVHTKADLKGREAVEMVNSLSWRGRKQDFDLASFAFTRGRTAKSR
jgi:hypothetical protein